MKKQLIMVGMLLSMFVGLKAEVYAPWLDKESTTSYEADKQYNKLNQQQNKLYLYNELTQDQKNIVQSYQENGCVYWLTLNNNGKVEIQFGGCPETQPRRNYQAQTMDGDISVN